MGSLLSSLRGLPELPQARIVELLLVSDVDVLGPCCSCREKEGVLKCSGCRAVAYCGEECQEKGWSKQKDLCYEISQLVQQTKEAMEDLANEHGGVEALLESRLVKEGRFQFRNHCHLADNDPTDFRLRNSDSKSEKYDLARWKLIIAYARCGKEASSKLAFRLAAENLLQILQLCRKGYLYMPEFTWFKYCGWMVAGGMDQQALNFLSYVIRFGGGLDFLDLSLGEDIEGVSLVQIIKDTPRMWNQDFMLISLIKYKRIQALVAQRKEEEERWSTFMEGTQSSYGDIIKISGMSPVMEKLKGLVVDKSVDERVNLLTNQINDLLNEVNEGNPKLIPGILNRHVQMVDNPTLPEIDEEKEYDSHFGYRVRNIPVSYTHLTLPTTP